MKNENIVCLFHILGVIKWIFKRFMFYLPNPKSWMLIFIWYIQKGHQFCGVTIVLHDMICTTHDSSFHEAKGSIRDLLISPSPVESSPVLYLQRGEWSWRGLSGLQLPAVSASSSSPSAPLSQVSPLCRPSRATSRTMSRSSPSSLSTRGSNSLH